MHIDYTYYSNIFKTLSDETRLKICCIISKNETCGCDLLEQLNITQPTLSYHMKILCEAGIANGRKDGAWMRYSINNNCIKMLQNALESLSKK